MLSKLAECMTGPDALLSILSQSSLSLHASSCMHNQVLGEWPLMLPLLPLQHYHPFHLQHRTEEQLTFHLSPSRANFHVRLFLSHSPLDALSLEQCNWSITQGSTNVHVWKNPSLPEGRLGSDSGTLPATVPTPCPKSWRIRAAHYRRKVVRMLTCVSNAFIITMLP